MSRGLGVTQRFVLAALARRLGHGRRWVSVDWLADLRACQRLSDERLSDDDDHDHICKAKATLAEKKSMLRAVHRLADLGLVEIRKQT
jgi:hypothetical protein